MTTSIDHFLAEVLVILGDVARIVEREIHHRRFVAVHLQDEAVRLLGSLGGVRFGNRIELRRLRRLFLFTCASDDGAIKSSAAIAAAAPAIFLSFIMEFSPDSGDHQLRGLATACGHLHAAAIFSRTVFSPPSEKCPSWAHACPGGEANGDVALLGERLQQAHDVAVNAAPVPNDGGACRKLHRLIVIDAVGDRRNPHLCARRPVLRPPVRCGRRGSKWRAASRSHRSRRETTWSPSTIGV